MQIVLTGASGFVGQNLIKFFHRHKVGVIFSLNLRETLPDVFPTSNAIIHLAGKAHDIDKNSSTTEYLDVNVGLTKKMFDLFLKSDCPDFVYFSSVKAAADAVEGILTEDIITNPKTIYGQSKKQAEEYLLSKDLPIGKRLFILRPCMIHGPGNKGNLNLLYKFVKKGIPYPLGAFDNKRSFLSIDNVCFVLEEILKNRSIPGGIYNLADDEELSTKEVIQIIGKASHSKARIWNIPAGLINCVVKIGGMVNLPLNPERLQKLTESYVVSNEKIKNVLGVKTLPVTSEEGLLKTIRSFGS